MFKYIVALVFVSVAFYCYSKYQPVIWIFQLENELEIVKNENDIRATQKVLEQEQKTILDILEMNDDLVKLRSELLIKYQLLYKYICTNNTTLGVTSPTLEPLRYVMTFPSNVTEVLPDENFLFPEKTHVLRIFVNSLISDLGEYYCDKLNARPIEYLRGKNEQLKLQYHEEVFVITQFWESSYFHRMVENIPRLSLFVKFLRRNPTIKILTADNSSFTQNSLETLGISKDRIITGWTRAKIAYIPRLTSCETPELPETPFVLELQFLNHYYREYITEHLPPLERNKLILIKRSKSRHFTQHGLIEHYLKDIAHEFGFEYFVFNDNPAPSFNETIMIFGSASIIVAPHGAGLSNMLYLKPGTLVIEKVCGDPQLDPCHYISAYHLGMIYHAIVSTEECESIVSIDAKKINGVLREYLSFIPIKQLTT